MQCWTEFISEREHKEQLLNISYKYPEMSTSFCIGMIE